MKRIGVIGFGGRIRHMVDVLHSFDAGVEIVAVVDPAAETLKAKFPERFAGVTIFEDVPTMLDTAALDGVMIGTWCHLHTPYAIEVLRRNLPLFLEKPVAIEMQQVLDLHAAWQQSSSQVVVSFPLRLSRLCGLAKEVADSGVLGSIEHAQVVNNVPFYGSNYYHGWMRNESLTGGLWLQKATHDLDYINFLLGKTPERMIAVESKTVFTGTMPAGLYCKDCELKTTCPESQYNLFYMQGIIDDMHEADQFWNGQWQCSFAVDTGNHDSATTILQYQGGMHAVYSQCFYPRRGAAKRGATLVGYKGTLSFDWYTDEVTVHHHHSNRVERHRLESHSGAGHHGGDLELMHDFLAILNGTGASRATLDDGLLSAQMCLMAKRSCQTNAFEQYVPLAEQAQTANRI